ncbi:hypothetical protein HYZ97_01230 [Candidatus Pacearchaeota archaeon]|nr:hypothetical protein [Candidatus Pacearchaeota archaeon]
MDMTIKELTSQKLGKKLATIYAMVNSVNQTAGPTLFSVTDGTGTLVVKAFEGAGIRAYPEVDEGDFVEILLTTKEFNKMLEGEAIKMRKLDAAQTAKAKERIDKLQRERATPKSVPFLVPSKTLDALRERFLKAAAEIRLAVIMNRPIIVRHHNDADGYSSGFALERAILPLVKEQHGEGKALAMYFNRAPSATPFYEIEDSIKDTAHSLTGQARFAEKIPLIVIVDTGSSAESLLAIQQGKVHGIDFIVVDHHFFEEDVISKEVLVHINPFLVGEDGATYSAGMLCTELGRFINPEIQIDYIPAMAGFADMIDNPLVMDAYLKLAEKKGYTKQLLHDIAAVIDFVSTKLRFMEAREYVEVLFGEPMSQQKKLVGVLAPYIRKLEAKSIGVARAAAVKEKQGNASLQLLHIEETFSRGVYPKPGRINGMLHDLTSKSEKKLVSAGVLSDALTIRATEDSGFHIHDFIAYVQKEVPEAFVEGGGHHHAGAIRFVPSKKQEVLKALREYLKKLD